MKKELDLESYHVLREKGTERPFTGQYYLNKETESMNVRPVGMRYFSPLPNMTVVAAFQKSTNL